jgi:hypothetical protein
MTDVEADQGPDEHPFAANMLQKYLLYGLSLPERSLRSGVGAATGILRESTELLVPQAFRSSKTYSVMVQQMLDFLAEDVGGVERPVDGTNQAGSSNQTTATDPAAFTDQAVAPLQHDAANQPNTTNQADTVLRAGAAVEAVSPAGDSPTRHPSPTQPPDPTQQASPIDQATAGNSPTSGTSPDVPLGVPSGDAARPADQRVDQFVARKAVGNFVEMASLSTLHLSPIMLLAVVSDVAYGSSAYLNELSAVLKKQGVIDQASTIDHVEDLLGAVSRATSTTASSFDTPPLSVAGLQETIATTREAVSQINPAAVIPQAELQRMWDDIHDIAVRDNVGLLDVSTAMTLHTMQRMGKVGRGALSTMRVAGRLFDRHVIDHYQESLGEIQRQGFYATLAEASGPYLDAVWKNFSTERSTITEDLLSGKTLSWAWGALRDLFGDDDTQDKAQSAPDGNRQRAEDIKHIAELKQTGNPPDRESQPGQ